MKLAGFDIGGTKCAVILGEETANGFDFLSRIEFKTEGSPETVIEKLVGLLLEEMRLHGCPKNSPPLRTAKSLWRSEFSARRENIWGAVWLF